MSPRRNTGFTLIEVRIIAVIVLLLAAMMIPAFQKVRDKSILLAAERGERLNESHRKRYYEIMRDKAARNKTAVEQSPKVTHANPSPATSPFQKVTIDGQDFYLIPKQDAKETEIAGKTFWLIPEAQ